MTFNSEKRETKLRVDDVAESKKGERGIEEKGREERGLGGK
jgi:hypothetical protein